MNSDLVSTRSSSERMPIFAKLLVEHPACQRALDDVGAVETVHAVGSNHRSLLAHHLAVLDGKVVAMLETLLLKTVDKIHDTLDFIPLHSWWKS